MLGVRRGRALHGEIGVFALGEASYVRRLYQARVERLPERQKTVDVSKTQEGFAGADGKPNTNGLAKAGGAPTNKNQPGAVGRNQPCPCGSGKKYKHCCGKNA